jgi:uncharacterized membrane protein YkvA (DUF1232 family)
MEHLLRFVRLLVNNLIVEVKFFQKFIAWAKALKLDVLALWFALKHPSVSGWAKAIAFIAVAYALSPIDLIPDFIPVLGYLDDLIIVPVLVWGALKLIPDDAMGQARKHAAELINSNQSKPKSYAGLFIVLVIWLFCLAILLEKFSL